MLYGPRMTVLEDEFTVPIDDLSRSVQEAEQELASLRQRQRQETERLWIQYQSGYERYLRGQPHSDPGPGPSIEAREEPGQPLPQENGTEQAPDGGAESRREVSS